MKHIKSFLFDRAEYILEDENGNIIKLVVDYKNNRFNASAKRIASMGYPKFKKEVDKVAKDLLMRKSGINRVRNL